MIVAELSANHLGSRDRALHLVEVAAAVGADAIKVQTFTPEQMVNADLRIHAGPWKGQKALDLYRLAHTPREWHKPIFEAARALGVEPFASVFHPDDVDFLEREVECPRYKIASFELTDTILIGHAARTGKPIIISTGMANGRELAQAVAAAGWPNKAPTLLKCTSAYPAAATDANLATMVDMGKKMKCPVGLSDHTMGIGVAVAAAALGATMIEKHLTLRRADGGPDAAFSMEPGEFAQMVAECRRAAAAIGTVCYGPTESEATSLPLRRPPGGQRGLIT